MMNQPEPSPLVSVPALQEMLGKPGLLIVDCRYELGNATAGSNAYQAGHIPGATFASMDDELAGPRGANAGRHPLPTPEAFAATLGSWGFTSSSWVVAYDQGNGAPASRLWWLLRAMGHRNVQVLDGGYAAWLAAGKAVTTAVPQIAPTRVTAHSFAGLESSETVVAGLAKRTITLVDARPADRFAGHNETIDPVAGHVPGAVNMPFAGNLNPQLQFLDAEQLRQRWAPLMNQTDQAPVVMMCGSGITACHNLLALAIAGYGGARLYAGSYSEWITDPARPVVAEEAGL